MLNLYKLKVIEVNIIMEDIVEIMQTKALHSMIKIGLNPVISDQGSLTRTFNDKNNALHLAVLKSRPDTVSSILYAAQERGELEEVVNAKNKNGKSPLEIAEEIANESPVTRDEFYKCVSRNATASEKTKMADKVEKISVYNTIKGYRKNIP